MSLDNIQIPPIVLQEMFTNALFDLKTENSQSPTPKAGNLSFLGENRKHVSIIVNHVDAIYVPDEELNFLLGILSACKLSMGDVALLNYCKNPSLSYTGISKDLASEKIILFGVDPALLELPLQFPHYQVQQFNNQVYLSSPSLKVLADDKAEKMKLWACLKHIFSIG